LPAFTEGGIRHAGKFGSETISFEFARRSGARLLAMETFDLIQFVFYQSKKAGWFESIRILRQALRTKPFPPNYFGIGRE
jgi:hypothetical protein